MFYVLAFVIAGLGFVYLRKRRARKSSARA
jgi:hypothetical protein